MPKSIALRFQDEPSSFAYTKLDREKLYGRKERQVVDAEGQRCTSAYLSADGAALVPSGGLALLYVDEGFATIERSQLRTVDDQGAEVPVLPASTDSEQPLEGPLPATRLLDAVISTVYELTPETVGPKLSAALASGQIFSAPFNARADHRRATLFLIGNDSGMFGLVGTPHGFTPIPRDAAPAAAAEGDDELSDDLDFSML